MVWSEEPELTSARLSEALLCELIEARVEAVFAQAGLVTIVIPHIIWRSENVRSVIGLAELLAAPLSMGPYR